MHRRNRQSSDFSAEIQAHIQLEIERLREQGLSEEAAQAAAYRQFGSPRRARETFYESGHHMWWDHLVHDVRYALRMLRKSPGFAAVAILTIALGIGATTAIFSVVDATLLHPLPFPHPEQLVAVVDDLPGVGAFDVGMSQPEWRDFERSGIFQYVSLVGGGSVNLTGSSQPARILFAAVTPNYFATLGVNPAAGGSFDPQDPTPGFNLQVLISDGLWKGAFGGDPNVVGRSVRLDNDLYRIIGVMPPSLHDPGQSFGKGNVDLWAAAGFAGDPAPPPMRKTRLGLTAIARLAPGLTIGVAQSRMNALVASLQKQFPDDYPQKVAWTVRLVPYAETVVGNVRQSLLLLLGAVGLVLLIGCVNVANLLLARGSARSREMAVRQALGAAPKRLVAQLLTEGILLSLAGGIVGLVILYFAKESLLRLVPDSLPHLNEISINWAVLLFALFASLLSGLIFGLVPALHARRPDLTEMLKREGRGSTSSGEQARARRALIITEFALSLVLMSVAGLLLRSFQDLLNVRLGFEPQSVTAVSTWLPIPNDPSTDVYRTPAQSAPFLRELLLRNQALPGVEEVAIGNLASLPLGHGRTDLNPSRLIVEGHEVPSDQAPVVYTSSVTPGYFHLLGMTLLRGREFTESDDEKAPDVVVINEAFARTYWPNEDPLGKHIQLRGRGSRNSSSDAWTSIIGVLADARTESLAESSGPLIYRNLYQRPAKDLAIFVRGRFDAASILEQVRRQVQSVNPELPVFDARSLDETLAGSLSVRRFSMELVALFAVTALLLAGLGIYGVISYIVSERTHEFGIRLALGAGSGSILRMVLRQGLGLALTGAAVGLVFALLVSHLMAGLLYGVNPTDPLTFAGVAILLVGVALLACYIPARRAIRVDPVSALRCE